ncbi:MAG: hypothetical protein J1F18_07515 [Lachnospiraceae bacterium]|nr:hypothetical protein [Lachnospiraceae bacterium]
MGYIIEKIQIRNLKYVTDDNPVLIDIEKSNMVILNGQNGYGKTTFFDAIELLVVGKIQHLIQIANKQSVSKIMEELANSQDKDIVVTGWLLPLEGERVVLTRKFKVDSEFESEIWWNDKVITQDELNNNLQITQSFFNMGTYISQSKSLSFLENKLKDRKALVTNLISTKDVDDKVTLLRDTSQALKEKIEYKQKELEDKVLELTNKIISLNNELIISQEAYKETEDYVRLFKEEYDFDKKEIETNISYKSFIEPLTQIRDFLLDFEDYSKIIKNKRIDFAINIPKEIYMKLFFMNLVQEIGDHTDIIKNVEKCHLYLSTISKKEWYVEVELCKVVGVSIDDINDIKKKIENLNTFVANLDNTQKSLLDLQNSRRSLIEKYHIGIESQYTERNICPLCGTFHKDIDNVFEEVEKSLLKSIEDSSLMKSQLLHQIEIDFERKVVPLINAYIEKNSRLYINSLSLNICLGLNSDELERMLREFNVEMGDFGTNQVAQIANFEVQYEKVKQELNGLKQNVSKVISEEAIDNYKTIHTKYYQKEKPAHSAEDIEKKIGYIAKKYVSDTNRKIAEFESKKINAEKDVKQFREASAKVLKNVSDLYAKYNDASKDYQSKLANAIRVPVLIYSGKIIQNFPLGLGINTKVAKNQLTFESFEKKGTDVFNILSTGQLNGLAISIMFAIRNVYGQNCGFNVMMIDDPLQTIDEISAISLADLLSNSDINQVIMSTHEDNKARMLEYKFKQRNLKIKEINMKQVYLKSKEIIYMH